MSQLHEQRVFHAIEPQLWRDRLYRIYTSESGLAGAWVAGQIWSEETARQNLQWLRPLLKGWVARILKRRCDLEAMYDSLEPGSPEFLAHDQRNFRLDRMEVRSAAFRRKRSFRAFNCGFVELNLADGSRRKWIVPDTESSDHVVDCLHIALGNIEESGSYVPPERKPMTPEQEFRTMRALGLLFVVLSLGVLAGPFLRPMSQWQAVGYFIVTVVNWVVAWYCFRQASKARRAVKGELETSRADEET